MTEATQYPPKLQFNPNIPVVVYFQYGDAKHIPSKNEDWGDSYKYNVDVDDVRHTWFATAAAHRELQRRGVGATTTLMITKVVTYDDNNKEQTRWSVTNPDGSERPLVDVAETPSGSNGAVTGATTQKAVMAPPESREDALLVVQAIAACAKRMMAQSEKIYVALGYTIDKKAISQDVQKLATSLFIEANKMIDITLLEQKDAPAPAPEPPPATPDDDLPF